MRATIINSNELHSAAPGLLEKSQSDGPEIRAVACQAQAILGPAYVPRVIEFIRRATKSIDIAAYTWKWYEYQASTAIQRLNYAIIEKARHGLPIRARFNFECKDHSLSAENTKTAQKLRRYGIQTKHDGTAVMSHLKMIIIDNEIVIIGSHNLTTRSVSQNNETSAALIGRDIVKAYSDYFEVLWNS